MLIRNYNSIMHTFYYLNHMYLKTKRDCFLLSNSFLTSGTVLWSVIIDSVLTWVTRGPLSAYIWSLQNYMLILLCHLTISAQSSGSLSNKGTFKWHRHRLSTFIHHPIYANTPNDNQTCYRILCTGNSPLA